MNAAIMIVSRLIVEAVEATGQRIKAELLRDEVRDLEFIQHYGFASRPSKGSDGIGIAIAGDRGRTVVIATEDRQYRPSLEDGEAALYSRGACKILVKPNGDVVVTSNGSVFLGSDSANQGVVRKSDLDSVVSALNAHVHGVSGSATTTPTSAPAVSNASTKVKSL